MNLPRVFVEVTPRPGGGWDVAVSAVEAVRSFTASHMEAVEVDVGGHRMRVPRVPDDRLPDPADEHYPLSSGDTGSIGDLLGRFAADHPKGNDALVYGRWLFECLLAPVWHEIKDFRAEQGASGVELALVCPAARTDPSSLVREDLHSLVWEAMHDRKDKLANLPDFLVVLTRVVRTSYDSPETITHVPKVLFAIGSALTDEVVRPGAMFMGLLRKFDADGICISRAVHDVSLLDLRKECETFRPDVVHLVAHGKTLPDGSGVLMLRGDPAGANATQLLGVLRQHGTGPVAVVLSACHSGGGIPEPDAGGGEAAEVITWRAAPLAAELVAGGIPIVTAMAGAVSEPACRMYTTRLIDAIHQGLPLGLAAAKGRAAALTEAKASTRELDWAMPTTFVSSSVRADFRPLDPTIANRLVGIADSLGFRRQPVFIGRHDILAAVDDLFAEDDRRTGFMAIINGDDGLAQQGSTRLLEEIAFRLLRAGHIPLLLAQYSDVSFGDVTAGCPTDLRAVIEQILQQAVRVTDEFRLRPPRLRSLAAADPAFAANDAVTGANLAALTPDDACQQARMTLRDFVTNVDSPRPPSLIKSPLGADLGELAGLVTAAGDPFGSHTRVVVLADRVHNWTGALIPLLDMIGSHGLGKSDKPIPVIVTSSLNENQGPRLDEFLKSHLGNPGFRPLKLTRMTDPEAAVGFQWVLLNPWHPDRQYHKVFVAARTTKQSDVEGVFKGLNGRPATVKDLLYLIIESHVPTGTFLANDDEAAIESYLELHR
jgi:hypothetical protein